MAFDFPTLAGAKTLPGSIKYGVNYEKVDPEGCILDAEAYIYGTLRCREMKFGTALAVPQGASAVAVPANYLDPLDIVVNETGDDVVQATEKTLNRLRIADAGTIGTGPPSVFSVWNEAFQFSTAADRAYTLALVYYGTPAALSSDNPTNFLTRRYPTILRAACLMAAGALMSDDPIYQREKARTDELLARALVENDYALRGIR